MNEKKSFSLSGKVPTYFDPLKEVVKRETGLTLETFQFIHDEPEIKNPFSGSFSKALENKKGYLWNKLLNNKKSCLKDIEAFYALPLKYRPLAQEYYLLKKEERYEDEDRRLKVRQLLKSLIEFMHQADDFKCIGCRVKERRDEDRWNKGDCQERKKIASKYDYGLGAAVRNKMVVLRKE